MGMATKRIKPIDLLTTGDVGRMLDAMPETLSGTRNRALVHLLWKSGLRVSEAMALRPVDVEWREGSNARLNVRSGKGGRQRFVVLFNGANRDLREWLELRATLGATDADPIFCGTHADATGDPMARQNVNRIVQTAAARAGIVKRVHPHAFRHAHATELFYRDAGLPAIQRQLGHTEPMTTQTYLQSLGCDAALDALDAVAW